MAIERINGRLTKVPETRTQDLKLQQFQKIKEARQTREQLKDAGRKLTIQLNPTTFTGTVSDYIKALNSIDSRIKPFMGVNVNSIKNEQTRRATLIQTDIRKSERTISSLNEKKKSKTGFDKEKVKAAIDGEKARINSANSLLNRVKGGELLDLKKVRNFLNKVEDETEKESKLRRFNELRVLKTRAKQVELAKTRASIDLNQFVGKGLTIGALNKKGLSNAQINAIGKAEIANRDLTRELTAIKQGRTSPGKLLKEGKITARQATTLVRDFELSSQELNKLRNANVNLIFERLETGKGRTIVDATTQTRAFKIGVNQALARELEKPIPFNATVEKFNRALKQLEIKKKKFQTVARKAATSAISKQTQSIENKVLTGQTITPQERIIFLENVGKSNKALNKAQADLAKTILKSPVTYVSSLIRRTKAGERAPLVKDLLNVGRGIGKGLKEIFVDPLTGSFNYGRSLVLRAVSQGTTANKILVGDIKRLASGVKSVTTFVKNNPVASGIIVGAAVATGFKLTKTEFKNKPAESLGRAIAWFFPGRVLKVAGKSVAFTAKGVVKVTKLTNSDKILSLLIKSKTFLKLGGAAKLQQRKNLLARAIVENTKFKVKGIKLESTKLNLFNKLKKLPENSLKNKLNKFPVISKKLFTPKKVAVVKLTKLQLRKNLLARNIVERTKFKSTGNVLIASKKRLFNRLNKLTIKQLQSKLPKLRVTVKKVTKKVPITKLTKLQQRKNLLARAIVENTKFKVKGKKLITTKQKLFNKLNKLTEKTLKSRLSKIRTVIKKRVTIAKKAKPLTKLQQRKNLLARAIVENTKFKVKGKKLIAARLTLFNRLRQLPLKTLSSRLSKIKVVRKRIVKKKPIVITLEQLRKSATVEIRQGLINVRPKKQIKVIDISKINTRKFPIDVTISSKRPVGKLSLQQLNKKLLAEKKVINLDLTKPSTVPKKVTGLSKRMGKRGQANLFRSSQKQIQKNIREVRKIESKIKSTRKTIEISRLQSRLAKLKLELNKVSTTLRLINSRGLAPTTKFITVIAKLIKKIDKVGFDSKRKIDLIKGRKPKLKVGRKPITALAKKPAVTTAQRIALAERAALQKATPTQFRNIMISKLITSRTTKKIKLPNLKLTMKIPKKVNLSFNMRYRRKGKVITRNLQLPFNKALRQAILLVKGTPARSTELFLVGITKEKDIKRPSLKDFKLRKVNSKALLLVEVPKSAIKGLKRK